MKFIDSKEQETGNILCASKLKQENEILPCEANTVECIINVKEENASVGAQNFNTRIYKVQNCGDNVFKEDSVWNSLYIILVLLSSILFSFPIVLFPQHNSIKHPEYWYESGIITCLSAVLTLSLETLISIKYYFEVPSMVSFGVFLQLYFVTAMLWMLTSSLTYLFWTMYLGYNAPMPFTLLLIPMIFIAQYVTLYILLSRNELVSSDIKKRIKPFMISRVWVNVVELQYQGLSFLFILLPLELQWILAFLLPFIKEVNYKILYHIMIDSLQLDNGKLGIIVGINAYNALYVAIKLGHTATLPTSICILIVEFVINLYNCHRLINVHRSIAPDLVVNDQYIKKREYQLSKLILTELMEVILPLAYIVTVVVAYYGPNAEILGNIGNNYWQYSSIDDLRELILSVLLMAIVDFFSALIVGYWLWKVCSIDFLRESCCLIGDIWEVPTLIIANFLNYVSLTMIGIFIV